MKHFVKILFGFFHSNIPGIAKKLFKFDFEKML